MTAPILRFKDKGRTYPDWVEKKLKDCVTFSKGGSLSKSDLSPHGLTPCLLYGELYTTYGEVTKVVINKTDSTEDLVKSQMNDVILPMSGETAEDIAKATCIKQEGVAYGGDLMVLRSKSLDGCFLSYSLNSVNRRQISRIAQGKTVVHINPSRVSDISINFACLEEQQKIAAFLTVLDEKICIANKKLKQVELMKKAWIGNFINGGKINSNEWRNVFIKDVCTSFSGGTPSTSNKKYYIGTIPLIRSGEIHSSKTELFISDIALKESSAKMVKKGDILYALYGATSGECALSKIEGAINQAILCIRPKADGLIDPLFLVELLAFNKNKILAKYLQGGQGNLSGCLVMGLELCVPSYSEQERFSAIVSQINKKMQVLKQKIDYLNRQKQAFMQQMFV